MSTAHLPPQPRPSSNSTPLPTAAPHASEATRLLCAGTYLDATYRDRVVDELYLMDHRVAAPSLGFDAARVLAHALRARRVELAWAWGVLGLLAAGVVAAKWWMVLLVIPGLLLVLAQRMLGTVGASGRHRLPVFVLRWVGRLLLAYLVYRSLVVGFGLSDGSGDKDDETSAPSFWNTLGDFLSSSASLGGPQDVARAWLALAALLAMGACVVGQQLHFDRVLRGELSPEHFPDAANDPAERDAGRRFQRLKGLIRAEQHASLVMYHEARPFCGAGTAYDTWVLAVELRPDGEGERRPIGNSTLLAAMRPFLEQLREVAETAAREGWAVRDRLRQLRVDECVFLPAEGLPHREYAPYDQDSFARHRAEAVEEGGEKRRHFLRVRVHGWEEDLVVTVFVRVHTQGRMLMLEVAPHVLLPIREDFREADHEAYRFAQLNGLGKAVHILTQTASAPGRALVALGRRAVHNWRRLTGEFAGGPPEGPAVSVREIAARPRGSLFQTMDVDRYLRSVQDRIAYGVKTALAEAGYQTGEFTQKIINISNGGVHIDSVDGSTFAIGDHARATTGGGATPPRRDSFRHDQ
ncbi:hypothetical protein [Streptomyces sp. NPDC057702]|uniref:hypothetical protein n=1 Tax=unclassified Streptomyces TaxID=2593676 RepID=UPI0036BA659A